MLTRLISTIRPFTTTTSIRLLSTSTPRFGDGDHTRSKAEEKAAADLKSGKEKRWLDTVASDSEAIIKGEKQHAVKQGDRKKDVTKLQKDTIAAVKEKEAKGHLHKHDVGRRDAPEERTGNGGGTTKQKKR